MRLARDCRQPATPSGGGKLGGGTRCAKRASGSGGRCTARGGRAVERELIIAAGVQACAAPQSCGTPSQGEECGTAKLSCAGVDAGE